MKPKDKLLEELIKSLNTEPEKWVFGEHTADNEDWGIRLWIANIPILDLGVYKPTKVSFSLLSRIRLYRAMNQCRAATLLKLKPNK
jgi:hypothetical protein